MASGGSSPGRPFPCLPWPVVTEGPGRPTQPGWGIGRPAPHAPEPAAFTRTGLSAVTLEPLRPRAAHIVQLRSIAAVRQGGSDGPDNGQEIHPLFPTPFAHACSGRNFRPTHGTCAAIM